MKTKQIVPQLPDPPLEVIDLPETLPIVSQTEIVHLSNAYNRFRLALADYEMKRAALTLKLLQNCRCEEGSYEIELNQEGGLILTDRSGVPFEREVMGKGGSLPAIYQ